MFPHRIFNLYQLLRVQWDTPPKIKEIQENKLKRLIDHAYQKVPYYRELFDSLKLKPQDIKGIEDLQFIPITTKKQLQELPLSEILAENVDPKQCKSFSTSGTTGVPLTTYFTFEDSSLKSQSWARAFLANGMQPWFKIIAFIGQESPRTKRSWYEYLGIWRKKEISTWDTPEAWIENIRRWNPQVFMGYVMTLRILGESVQTSQAQDIRPKLIFHSSAVLDESSRQYLESVFHCKVIDIYGSDEAGCIAWECMKCSAYHLCSDMVIVEVLKNGKPVSPGEEGEVVITNLHSDAMPFIRYKQEDVATLSLKRSVCGRGLPLLDHVCGRTDDFITLRNGRKLSPHPFYHSIDPLPGLRRWRIVQENVNKLVVEVEPKTGFSYDTKEILQKNLRRLVGNEIEIDVILTEFIKIDPSSKFRAVSSKIGVFC